MLEREVGPVSWRRLATILGIAIVGIVALRAYLKRDYRPMFARAAGELVEVRDSTNVGYAPDGAWITDVTLVGDTGLRVKARVRAHPERSGREHPAAILIGGFETGRAAVQVPPSAGDLVIASIEYPYDGPRRGLEWWEWLRWLPVMRRGVMDTAPALLLTAQYLYVRSDVDPGRVSIVGVSLGVPFAVAAAATDRRLAAVALLHGGGDLSRIFAHAYHDLGPPPLVRALGTAVAWIVAPLEPTRYVDDIAPRPLLMVNATGDRLVPAASAVSLYRAAERPKRLEWIATGHVMPGDRDVVVRLLQVTLAWLRSLGLAGPAPPGYSESSPASDTPR